MTPGLFTFDYQLETRIVFGENAIERLGDFARDLASHTVLLVTDAGIVASGHAERAVGALKLARLSVFVFDGVKENPTTRDVEACLEVARGANIDLIVGLGGGSSLDTAKGCNFLLTNGGRMQDYLGIGKATHPMLPMIAIPTTAGTGSETQSAALITDEITHQKMACLDRKATPRIAVLDPVLTITQPGHVTACTGVDALAHALETYVTVKRTAISKMFSGEAFRKIARNLSRVHEEPTDLEARGEMLLGACFAGLAIENSMLGATHSAANPLTVHHGLVHGQAVGIMLPHVLRFNAEVEEAKQGYAELAVSGGLVEFGTPPEKCVRALASHVEHLLNAVGMPASLAECGVLRTAIPALAQDAALQWTAQFNPRPVVAQDFERIYLAALSGRSRHDR